jgi:glycosyltransferase involved in cell wall biosynthesis
VWKRRLLGWLLARCSVVTAVSKDTAARLGNVAWPVPVGVRVIYGAGDVPLRQRIDPEVKAFGRANALLDGRVVAQVGPMNFALKVAGFLQLLEAAAIVRQTCPDVRLLLIGHGRLRGQVHDAIARLGLNDAVTVTGYLDDVSVALALTDVYCQITFQDACPLSLLEAMYAARPAVASRTGGIPELITDEVDGLLVDNDPRQIAAAIVRLLERPEEAAQLGQRAASTARARFTWDYVADEFAVAYGLAPRANVSTERSRA